MNNDFMVWGLLAVALILANWPFISNRLYLVKQIEAGKKKPVFVRLIEWLVLYFVVGLLALMFESKMNGQIHPQDWEFYAVTVFMFMVLALPGFIYRYTFLK